LSTLYASSLTSVLLRKGLPKLLTRPGRYPGFPLRNWWARSYDGAIGCELLSPFSCSYSHLRFCSIRYGYTVSWVDNSSSIPEPGSCCFGPPKQDIRCQGLQYATLAMLLLSVITERRICRSCYRRNVQCVSGRGSNAPWESSI
jgi:hypothetical protein